MTTLPCDRRMVVLTLHRREKAGRILPICLCGNPYSKWKTPVGFVYLTSPSDVVQGARGKYVFVSVSVLINDKGLCRCLVSQLCSRIPAGSVASPALVWFCRRYRAPSYFVNKRPSLSCAEKFLWGHGNQCVLLGKQGLLYTATPSSEGELYYDSSDSTSTKHEPAELGTNATPIPILEVCQQGWGPSNGVRRGRFLVMLDGAHVL